MCIRSEDFHWQLSDLAQKDLSERPAIYCQKASAWPKKAKTPIFSFSGQCKSLLEKKKKKKASDKKGDVWLCF